VWRGCAFEKNAKIPFTSSYTRYKGTLYLIHLDVSIPMSSPSLSGYFYYVIFIYDFSRNTWIYFLKSKTEVFSKFQEFRALVENQTERHIRV
jgi:hypothetical protein